MSGNLLPKELHPKVYTGCGVLYRSDQVFDNVDEAEEKVAIIESILIN